MITSTANAKVKRIVNLKKKRKARDEEKVFLVEGMRMFLEVPADRLLEVYVSESCYKKEKRAVDDVLKEACITPELLSDTVFSYASDTKSPQGILCVLRQMEYTKEQVMSADNPMLLVMDNLQDPGNMGTIIRTAEGAGVSGIVMSKDCVDIYNPKTIRSTMGSIYRMPFYYEEDIPGMVEYLEKKGIRTFAAHLEGRNAYDEEDYRGPCAFLIGNEGSGLREEAAKTAGTYVKIPMKGQVESLNAAIAASILIFEAGRQRRHM